MTGFIIWMVGLVLTIIAALEVWKLHADTIKKGGVIVLLLLTNWVGLAFYYLYGRDKMARWLRP